jgi:hypothetical protein
MRFMVCVTDGVVPIPRCPVADAAEVVGSSPSSTMLDYFEQFGFQVVPQSPGCTPMMT